jgi:hypothetical protein
MDDQGIERIEGYLKVKLPEPYVLFLKTLPEGEYVKFRPIKDGSPGVGSGPIYADADRLIVENLRLRAAWPKSCKTPWPEQYLAIAETGCGDYDFIDVGEEPSAGVLTLDHETGEFGEIAPTIQKYIKRQTKGYTPEAFNSNGLGGELAVARTDAWWKSILDPISLDEWESYVKSDPEMRLVGYEEGRNPFTKERMRINRPGLARWKTGPGRSVKVYYNFGRLEMEGGSQRRVEKMRQIARALGARLFE